MKARHAPPPQPCVLVTGAAGFIGSHLCERLLAQGMEVIALDDLSSGDEGHIAHLRQNPLFHFIKHDITLPLPAELCRVQRIYNLACPSGAANHQRHPVQTVLSSTLGVWRLVELAQSIGARLLQVSSSEVYGDPQVHPQHEGYWGHVNPIGARSSYAEGKRCAETICRAYARERGIEIRIARLFNTYGPRLRPGAEGGVIGQFVTQALSNQPLTVYGSGQQTRSYCYVDDAVNGLLQLMDSDREAPVNIGSPEEYTVLELAERILRLTSSRSRIEHRLLPPDDPALRQPHLAIALRELAWQPRVMLDDGLQRTIAYFRRRTVQEIAALPATPTQRRPAPVRAAPAVSASLIGTN